MSVDMGGHSDGCGTQIHQFATALGLGLNRTACGDFDTASFVVINPFSSFTKYAPPAFPAFTVGISMRPARRGNA